MRKLLAALTILVATSLSARAQNYIVPTAPFGTNSNQAASTAFVQQALVGLVPAGVPNAVFSWNGSGVPQASTILPGALTIPNPTITGATIMSGLPTTGAIGSALCLTSAGGVVANPGANCYGGSGGGGVNNGTINDLGYYAATGATISALATANNGVLVTSSGGAPSISSTLPAAVQGNITALSAGTALSNLGYTPARSGANSDITSLAGLTTPLTVPQGGSGAATFSSNLPLIGAGASALAQGTVSGNTTKFVTTTGALTNNDCVKIDSMGNFVDAGGTCTTGGGSGTVNSSTANNLAYYQTTGTAISGLVSANSGVLVTSGAGVPSISSTLPAAVQGNITVLASGAAVTNIGFTPAHTGANSDITSLTGLTTPLSVAQGGTGDIAFTANLPFIGNGTGAVAQGTRSGSTTVFATASGALVSGDCVSIDGSGNFVDAGGSCTTGGGGGTVSTGAANSLAYYAVTGTTVAPLATANSGTLITSGAGVPSISSTLPAAVQGNITTVGTIATGAWHGTIVAGTYGGTGVNNGASTITVAASLITTGAGAPTLAFPSSSFTYTFPAASGTLPELSLAQTWSAAQTFPNSSVLLLGSSTGYTAFTSGNSSATNYTFTIPPNNGTAAETNLAETWTGVQTYGSGLIAVLGSSTGFTTLTSSNASATNYSITFPAASGTAALTNLAQSFSGLQTFGALTATGSVTMSGLATSGVIANALCTTSAGLVLVSAGANCYVSSTAAAGSNSDVQYNGSGTLAANGGFTYDGTSVVSLGTSGTSVGAVKLFNATSGSITVQPATGALGSAVLTLPDVTGTVTALGNATTGSGSTLVLASGPTITGGVFNGTLGATTPSTVAATTISASGQVTSTVTTGSAPLVVASTTVVANLNAALLNGATFSAPGAIGGGIAAAGTFTSLTTTGNTILGGTLTAASLSTTGTVAGGICATSAGLVVYEAGGNCYSVSGAAGGDLSGSYPNPTVSKVNGSPLGSTTVTGGYFLIANGTSIASFAMSGDCLVSVSGAANIVCTKTNGVAFAASATTDTTNASNIASGNLAYARLTALSANQVLGALTATTPSGLGVPSCSGASNALTWTSGSGFGCNTLVAGGNVSNTGTPVSGQLAQWTNATTVQGITLVGDCSLASATITCVAVNGVSYGTSPATNTVAVVTGVTATTYEKVPNAAILNPQVTFAGQTASLGGSATIAYSNLSSGAPTASTSTLGLVKVDGTSITITAGVISATTGGGGNVSNVGTPTNGQFAQWTTATTIQGVTLGTFSTQNYATPPAIGGTTPAAAAFTTLTTTGSRIGAVRTATSSPVTISATADDFICVNDAAAVTVNLPSSPATGLHFTVKDCGGNAATGSDQITITPSSGNIDGAATYVINIAHGAVNIEFDGTQWEAW